MCPNPGSAAGEAKTAHGRMVNQASADLHDKEFSYSPAIRGRRLSGGKRCHHSVISVQ